MRSANLLAAAIVAVLGLLVAGFFFHMSVNCWYVEEGHSLMLSYKGPLIFGSGKPAAPGQFAQPGEVGVLEQLRGPGRHFYCPLWWVRKDVVDVVVKPGEVAIVTSKMGDDLPENLYLVEGGIDGANRAKHKGILRKVLGPGRYRIHPYAFDHAIIRSEQRQGEGGTKHSGWVNIPAGYVGVVTFQADDPLLKKLKGVQSQVLPPGIYPVNPRAQEIDLVEIGFRETSMSVEKHRLADGSEKKDESGEPEAISHTGIGFPSNDGFHIQIDFTAIWGVMPEDAPEVVRTFGNVQAAEQKVIVPQCESICRNNGSKMGANDLLVGETRQVFQDDVSDEFQAKLKETNISLLYGLVRHIYIPKEVRVPLQKGYVADELTLTREEDRTTKQAEGELREAEKIVLQEAERVKVESLKIVASAVAEGARKVGEIEAATKQQIASVDKQIAELEAQRTELLGKAEAQAEQLLNEATSQKFELAVKAFGGGQAYSKYQFAEGLPENIQLQLFYAGEGTLWTDLKGIQPTLPLTKPAAPPAKPTTATPSAK